MTIDKQAIDELTTYLIDRTLLSPITPDVFREGCERLRKAGISILRVNMSWGTLHPTIGALTLKWWKDKPFDEIVRYFHQDGESDEWLKSPGYYALKNDVRELEVYLDKKPYAYDFPILDDFQEAGGTHYLLNLIPFSEPSPLRFELDGVLLTFLSDAPNGFSDEEKDVIRHIQRYMALTLKVALRERITQNTLTAYLGENAATRVLSGTIKLGDGETVKAVIWYSDLRNSTDLGDTLPGTELLATLNSYFSCTAGSVMDHGGEVLRFVGDGVLAIFPAEDGDMTSACAKATIAAQTALQRLEHTNKTRKTNKQIELAFGLGLHVGDVMFGNIGIPERLDFSVTGPAANEVARIESMTKVLNTPILASRNFASLHETQWQSLGEHPLRGIGRPIELFTLKNNAL